MGMITESEASRLRRECGLRMRCGAGHLRSRTNALATTGCGVAARGRHTSREAGAEGKTQAGIGSTPGSNSPQLVALPISTAPRLPHGV